MGRPVILLQGTSGLNTKDDPARLAYDGETGVRELAKAVNVVVEPSGRISRREGFALQDTGVYRDVFCDGGEALCVKDDNLCLLHPDLSVTTLRAVTPGARMSYVQARGRVYYTNEHEAGYVEGGQDRTWGLDTYAGPDTDKAFVGPPVGHFLEFFNGRMFIAEDNVIWNSERFFLGLYNLAGNHLHYPSRIKMVEAVSNGLWVSDSGFIYWVEGYSPENFVQVRKAAYPATEGAAVKVDADKLAIDELLGAGLVVVFLTTKGVCLGGPAGFFLNLTQSKLETEKSPYPFDALHGAGAVMGNQVVFTLEP